MGDALWLAGTALRRLATHVVSVSSRLTRSGLLMVAPFGRGRHWGSADPATIAVPPLPSIENADAATAGWWDAVLGGQDPPPSGPPDDPEAPHDAARLRGIALAANTPLPRTCSEDVHRRVLDAVGTAARGITLPREIFWDTTTTALRALNLLRLDATLRERDAGRSVTTALPPAFLGRHRLVLALGALTEPAGNHEAVNAAAGAAVDLLVRPDAPLTGAACRRVGETFARQLLPDGGHVERSPHYHVQILDLLTALCHADRQRGGSCGRYVAHVVERARSALNVMMAPAGQLVRFGDISRTFSGEIPGAQATRLADRSVAATDLDVLPDFGLVRCRWNARGVTAVLFVDVGAVGMARNSGHGHADILSYVLYLGDGAIIVDPGTFLYADTPHATWFKLPEAHTTVRWAGQPCYALRRFFRWSRLPSAPTLHTGRRDGGGILVTGVLRWRSREGWFTHRRRWYPRPDGLVVVDDVEAPVNARAVARVPIAPGVAMTSAGRGLVLQLGGLSATIEASGAGVAAPKIVDGWYAAHYGVRERAPAIEWCLSTPRGVSHARTQITLR